MNPNRLQKCDRWSKGIWLSDLEKAHCLLQPPGASAQHHHWLRQQAVFIHAVPGPCICSELSNKYPFCSAPISILQMMRRCSTQRAGPHVERQICAVETAQHKMQYLVRQYEFWTPAFHGPSQRSLCAACSCSRATSNQRYGRLMLPHHFTMGGLDIAQPRRCLCAKLMLSKM